MDRTGKRLIMLAVLLAVVGGLGVYRFLARMEKMSILEYTDEVVIAVKDIPARTTISQDMLKVERLPVGTRHPKAATQIKQVAGQTATQPIVAGEQVIMTRVFSSAQVSGLSFQLATGYRAVSIGMNQRISVGNQVRPGDYVDVVVSYELPTTARESHTDIMLQNIQVLAVGTEMKSGANGPAGAETITLAVEPEQAERLVWAEDYGKIRLILRPVEDDQIVTTQGASARNVTVDR